jgi:UDP-N-acetylmuramoylalanine--D-glutamate ligase
MDDLTGKRTTVVGLGRFGGGIAVSRWLCEQGARVLVTDQADPAALVDSRKQLDGLPVEYRLGEHREEDFASADLIVASPAVPPANPYLQIARDRGVPITTEIRLFIERCPARILGVTGTKGKSTATTLLGEMLKGRYITWVGGNMGRSLLFDLPRIQPDHLVVLELSSFMLEYLAEANWSPHVALVTFIAPDHLDRHGTMHAYLEAKKVLVRNQGPADYAILCEQCAGHQEFAAAAGGKIILYGLDNRKAFSLRIPGRHNQLNAQGAFTAASVMGISHEEAQEQVREFPGLPHRLQLVHEHCGVQYYNDSIATIPEAAIAALHSFPPRRIIQIVGGYDKKLPLTGLCAALVEHAKAALCIGDTGRTIAQMMQQASKVGAASAYQCGDLPTAMKMARQIAQAGDIILLSPGCASYGQFRNFEERGELFARLARGDSP